MAERMAVIAEIQSRTSTHSCPGCGKPAYCAMNDGRSASTCWCMSIIPKKDKPNTLLGEECVCRSCLVE
jgi:hypothetical protein